MKVLIVSDTLHAGGAETFVLRLARSLNLRPDVQAEVLSLNKDLENQILLNGFSDVVIHRINLPFLVWLKRLDRVLRMLGVDFSLQYYLTSGIIKRKYTHYDLYHTHLFPVDYLWAKIKARLPETIILSTLHGDYNEFQSYSDESKKGRKLNWSEKVAFVKKKVDGWVYISLNQLLLFKDRYKVPVEKLHKIYNGYESVEIKRQLPVVSVDTNGGLTFIMVARGLREKGWEFAVKAFSGIEGNDHRLLLVGKGAYLQELASVNKDSRIKFMGFHPNPAALIRQSDVFIFPSIYKAESLPTVVIEALYCNVPVISTRIGEVEDMIRDEATGELAGQLINYDTEAALVHQLTAGMKKYIENRTLLDNHRTIAYKAFTKFNMQTCVDKYINLYTDLCLKK